MKSLVGVVALASLCALSAQAVTTISSSEYKQRRQKLREAVPNSTVVLFGATERDHGNLRSPFFQEANFYYLTGWNQPGAILVVTPTDDVLLLPRRDAEEERWTGPKAAPGDKDISAVTGFEQVVATESFESKLLGWIESSKRIYTLTTEPSAAKLNALLPLRTVLNVAQHVARLRQIKSQAEIDLIQRATDAGVVAHKAAWSKIKPGLSEFQVAAAMSNAYFDSGCERHAYSPIVGSGQNATVLHYSRNERRMDAGELVLMDVGPECSMYATDITRTVPVNGKFTQRQREIYDIVLGAQNAAIAAIKPGVMLGNRVNKVGLHKIALDYINTHGKDKNGKPLGEYFIHGLGHHVGLDVHDANDAAMPLAPGMVITIEPGIYIPEEGIGVRIEDMVLVTDTGAKLLSSALPREATEVEKFMASARKQ